MKYIYCLLLVGSSFSTARLLSGVQQHILQLRLYIPRTSLGSRIARKQLTLGKVLLFQACTYVKASKTR